jgi:hypothetical protein
MRAFFFPEVRAMNKPYIHGMLPDAAEPAPAAKTEEPAIRFLGDMQRLQPKPGDVFVLTCEQALDQDTAECIKNHLSAVLGGAKVLVLDGGLKLGVVGQAQPSTHNVVNVISAGELHTRAGKLANLQAAVARRNL